MIWEKGFVDKILEGRKVVEEQDKEFANYRGTHASVEEELYRRWQEQSESIEAELKATGGKIGY